MSEASEAINDEAPTQPSVWTWILGTACLLVPFLFTMGWDAINQAEPDRAAAFPLYLLAFAGGAACIAGAVLLRQSHTVTLVVGAVLAGTLGISLAGIAESEYNSIGLAFFYMVFLFPMILTGYGVTLLVLGITRKVPGIAEACVMWGMIIGGSAGLAALYHMLTLSRQVQLAQEAHESPLGMVAVLVVLGLAAFLRRK